MTVSIQVQSNSRQAQADLRNLEKSLKAVEQSTVQINQKLASTGKLVKFAFASLPLAAVTTSALRTAISFEKLSARLDIVTGSAIKSAQAFGAVNKIVKDTPFSVNALADAYARLATSGSKAFVSQKQIERAVQNIADAAAAVGGGNAEVEQLARAFQRAAAEGRLTGQRLNQITDTGISLTKVAERLGLTMEGLRDETEKGTLTFNKFFTAFQDVAEAADGFGGAASRQTQTLAGAVSNLGDSLSILSDRTLRQSGITDILAAGIRRITSAINDFSEGIEITVFEGIAALYNFYKDAEFVITQSQKLFENFGSSFEKFVPSFNIDLSGFKDSLENQFKKLDIRSSVQSYRITLSDFIPGLESVKNSISAFGAYIKHVFWDIYDQVVGNSFWPDMIDGVVFYASGLLGKVKPYFDRFRDYVNGIFLEMKNSFDELFKDIQIKINVSSETGSIKTIANFIDRITTAFDRLVKAAKEQPIIVKTVNAVTEAINSIRQAGESIDPAVWSAMSGAFNAINIFAKDGLPRLLAAIGLTKDVKEVKSSSGGLGEATRNIADQLTSGSKDLADNLNKSSEGLDETFRTGILFSEQLQKVYNTIGETIGRIIGRVFFDEVYSRQDDFADFFALAVAAALSKPLRNLLAVTAVLTLVLGPDNNVSTILSKVFDSISQFGNKVLQGAGVTGFASETGLGGFLAGLLFGGLSLALVTGRLGPILLAITKTIGEYVFFRKVLGNSVAAIPDADKAGKTLGQKFGSAFNTAARTAGFGIGLAIGASLADDVIKGFNIENELTKVMVTAGLVGGAAYAGSWIASALVVFTGAKLTALWTAITVAAAKFFGTKALAAVLLAAVIPGSGAITAGIAGMIATIAGVLTLPIILTALGVLSSLGLLYYVFFGAGDDTFAGKFRTAIEKNVFEPLKSGFEDLMSFVGKGIEKLTAGFISFRKAAPITKGDSGDVSGFATGGRVRGPGSGTSDSIMAKLSNGEYVINANATRNNLPLLERINSGLPAFKDGGPVKTNKTKTNTNVSKNEKEKVRETLLLNLKKAIPDDSLFNAVSSLNFDKLLSYIGVAATIKKESAGGFKADEAPNPTVNAGLKYKTLIGKGEKDFRKFFNYPFRNFKWDEVLAYLDVATVKDFFNFVYADENRRPDLKLGNVNPNDGYDYRGRGWLQTTGRENYRRAGFENNPSSLLDSTENNTIAVKNLISRIRSRIDKEINIEGVASRINRTINPGGPDTDKIVAYAQPFLNNLKKANISAFATGGKVNGPGSGTSDSILAQLSNGEYVINAQATRQNLPLLEQINNGGLPKFNQGGGVNIDSSQISNIDLSSIVGRDKKLFDRSINNLNKAITDRLDRLNRGQDDNGFVVAQATKILENQIAKSLKSVEENTQEAKEARFAQKGSEQAEGFKDEFTKNLSLLLKGKDIEGGFAKALALDFTGRVVDSFTGTLVDGFFKASNLEGAIGGLFEGIFGLGDEAGTGLGGLFTKPKADGSSPEKAAYVKPVTDESLGSVEQIVKSIKPSGIPGVTPGSEQDKMLAEQMEGLPSNMDAIFEKFKFGFEDIANGDFLSGIGKIFDGGVDSFSSIFSSLGSLFGGGSGGGSGIGSLLSIGSKFFGLANGGYVRGSGTATSDSIPAMLSNGEYVINAKATKMTKPLLDAINQGKLPKFATGGIVGDSLTSANVNTLSKLDTSNNESQQQVFNINITGDVSRQTQSEIYKMLPRIANGVNSYNKEKNFRG